ncbi:MAG: hypothetical protein D6730_07895 [Bacteroidetes bacterium]|nr:MAG: hypothetical protein D6730_07895 [Bacteroidota bacterium]
MTACTRFEVTEIRGNHAPPDSTIASAIIERYINRLYIGLLGQKPSAAQLEDARRLLEAGNMNQASRQQLVEQLMQDPAYSHQLYAYQREDLLENLDTTSIRSEFDKYSFKRQQPSNKEMWPLYDEYLAELLALMEIPEAFAAGRIDMRELQRRCIDNLFYDELHMGTENFAVAMFEDLLLRYPTINELEQSKKMMAHQEAVVLRQVGQSREDFIHIVFYSDDYLSAQVRQVFLRFLKREPATHELLSYSALYRDTNDYKALQKAVLILDEYVGI